MSYNPQHILHKAVKTVLSVDYVLMILSWSVYTAETRLNALQIEMIPIIKFKS